MQIKKTIKKFICSYLYEEIAGLYMILRNHQHIVSLGKIIILISVLFFSPINRSHGQITFQHAYGGAGEESCHKIFKVNDGFALAGHTTTYGAGSSDFLLLKTDSNGYPVWSKTYGGLGQDIALSAVATNDNGFVLTGYSQSFTGFSYVLVVKSDSLGNMEWSKIYEDGWGYDISQTTDNGFIVTGRIDVNKTDMFLLKLDSIGNAEWSWIYGDSLIDMGRKVLQTLDGGYLVSGYAQTLPGGGEVPFLVKTNSSGAPIWSKIYKSTIQDNGYYGYAIGEINSGYIVSSLAYTDTYNPGGSADIVVFRIDSMGNLIWSKVYGGSGYDDSRDLFVNEDNTIMVAGSTNNWTNGQTDFLLMKIDENGNLIWSSSFGGSSYDNGYTMAKENNNSYVIAGSTNTYGFGQNDMFFAKTNASGLAGCNDNTFSINYTDFPLVEENTTSYSSISTTVVDVSLAITVGSPSILHDTVCETVIGIPEMAFEDGLLFYPNPSNGQITIEINSMLYEPAELKIIDLLGEEVFSESIPMIHNKHQHQIDLSNYGKGVYFLTLKTIEGLQIKRIIVQQ